MAKNKINRKFKPIQIKNILYKTLKRFNLYKGIKEQSIMLKWEIIVGDKISQHTKPVKINNGRLTINVNNSVWMQELNLLKNELIKKINYEEKLIKDIKFQTGEIT